MGDGEEVDEVIPFQGGGGSCNMDGETLDPACVVLDGTEVATTCPAAQVIARPEVNGQSPPSCSIQDQTQERNGHLVEYVDVLPEARPLGGDPPPRATYGCDFKPLPPFRMGFGSSFVGETLEVFEDAEGEVVWETEDRRVLEVPCVVDT